MDETFILLWENAHALPVYACLAAYFFHVKLCLYNLVLIYSESSSKGTLGLIYSHSRSTFLQSLWLITRPVCRWDTDSTFTKRNEWPKWVISCSCPRVVTKSRNTFATSPTLNTARAQSTHRCDLPPPPPQITMVPIMARRIRVVSKTREQHCKLVAFVDKHQTF